MADDPLIERTERAAARAAARARAGREPVRPAPDHRRRLRRLGVLLIILGLTESDAEIDKAAGVNINLWAGLGMLGDLRVFLVWAFTRPLGEELREARHRSTRTA